MIKTAICDDEPYIRSYLASLIRSQDPGAAVTEYASAAAYLSDGAEYDLLLLDIELGAPAKDSAAGPDSPMAASPDRNSCENGMDLARRIRSMREGPQPLIIFVTGYESYVYDAFDVDAFQYLLKPIDEQRFAEVYRRAAQRIRAKTAQQGKKLVIRCAGTSRILAPDDVYYMESQGHKIVLHLKDTTLEYYARLADLEQELQGQFYRIHKGLLVNLAYVEEYGRTTVTLANGEYLNLSKYKYDGFVKAHLQFMRTSM